MKTSGYLSKCLIVALTGFFSLTATSQPAGWRWQNPYLQGNDLNSIVMSGSIGWAVGDHGTVMKTENEGFDWELVNLGTIDNLNCIYIDIISGNGWIVGENGALYQTRDGGETWAKQYLGTSEILNSVTAIEGACPWICGNDVIFRSHDQGETWEKVNTIFHTLFFSIDLKACDEAWISGMQGLIISTVDDGASWQSHASGTTNQLFSIDIVANGDYRTCGYTGTILRSSDAGATWVKEHEKTFLYLYDVDTRGIGGPAYAVGGDGTILETLDGGSTWNQRVSGTFTYLHDVCFQAIMHGVYATGWYGIILRKEDQAGAEFEIMNERPLHFLQGMDFIGENTGWAVGGKEIDDETVEGVILHTTDGGENWEVQKTLPDPLSSVDFINENEGWAVGNNGAIRHTINGGQSWTTQTSPITGLLTSVFFIDEDTGWIVSRDNWGEIIHTTNGGNTWTLQPESSPNPWNDVFFINPSKGWVVGMDSSIMRTEDGGQTWLKCQLTVSNNPYLRSVQFIDELTGWAVGTGGFILKSTDGGITWYDVHSGYYELLQSVFFTDPLNGWASGTDGFVLRTLDGGETWFKQYTGVERNYLTTICFANTKRGWVAGEGGTIKRTDNGGFGHEPGVILHYEMNRPISDLVATRDTLYVDLPGSLVGGYQLVGLEVLLDSIMHSRAGDLTVYLTHNNVTDTLVRQDTDQGANFLWTRLKDDASILINEGAAPFSGEYRPAMALSAFNGMDPEGMWILTLYDNQSGNTGTLKEWGIKPLYEKMVSVEEPARIPVDATILLSQNIPNPFTRTTTISWSSKVSGMTTLTVCNISGQEVAVLLERSLPQGEYSVEFDRAGLSPGVYYFKLQVDDYMVAKKCVIL